MHAFFVPPTSRSHPFEAWIQASTPINDPPATPEPPPMEVPPRPHPGYEPDPGRNPPPPPNEVPPRG